MIQSEKSPDTMGTTMPLSPNSVVDGQLPHGFCELVQHNNSEDFPSREHNSAEAASNHSSSYPPSRLSTPARQAGVSPPQLQPTAPHQYAPQATYETQYFQPPYGNEASAYPSLPEESVQPGYSTPASSPSQRSDVISLRNGAVPRSTSMRPLASKSRSDRPPTKKGRAKAARKTPKITTPLSESTKHLGVPMIDIDAYVNRSEAERKLEVENSKTPGKIKRPMNAFMLYRKAYQGRTKEHCTQNNHQLVSQVCGDSWPLEPEHIRNQFTEWARIERENHAKTWPEYKFAPKKPRDVKRKFEDEVDGEDELPLEEYDHESGRVIKRQRSNRSTPVPESEPHLYGPQMSYYTAYSPQQQPGMMLPGRGGQMQLSSYEWSNPNKPMPAPYNHMALQQSSHYLSSQAMPTRNAQLRSYGVEDVQFHKTAAPGNPYQPPQQGLIDQYSTASQPQHPMDQKTQQEQLFNSAQYTQFEAHFDHEQFNMLYQNAGDGGFDQDNPLLLQHNSIESYMESQGGQVTSEGFGMGAGAANYDGPLDGQLRDLLTSTNPNDWHIQPVSEAQADSQFEVNWSASLDPSLSEPYNVQD